MVESIYGLANGQPIRANVNDCLAIGETVKVWREKVRHNIKEIRSLAKKVERERDLSKRYTLKQKMDYKRSKLCSAFGIYRKSMKDEDTQ